MTGISHDIPSHPAIELHVAGLHGATKCGASPGAHGHCPGLHPAGPRQAAGEQGEARADFPW